MLEDAMDPGEPTHDPLAAAALAPSPRIARIVTRCRSYREFLATYGQLADATSLFVVTPAPLAAGERRRFVIALADRSPVMEGLAEVVEPRGGPTGLAGMRLRFIGLPPASRAVHQQLLSARRTSPAELPARPPTIPPPHPPSLAVPTPPRRSSLPPPFPRGRLAKGTAPPIPVEVAPPPPPPAAVEVAPPLPEVAASPPRPRAFEPPAKAVVVEPVISVRDRAPSRAALIVAVLVLLMIAVAAYVL